jgi:hypothetical protein
MIRGILVACILAGLYGCVTEDPIQDIHKGVSKGQVIKFLGHPDASQVSGSFEALRYSNRPVGGSPAGQGDYNVILLQGFVIDYGYGYVKQRDPSVGNTLILVPLKADVK